MSNKNHGIISDLENLAMPIELFKALPGNPRKGNVEAVVKSYEKFGQRKPIVARLEKQDGNQVYTVISGNHQLLAAIKLGWTHIAATVVDEDVDHRRGNCDAAGIFGSNLYCMVAFGQRNKNVFPVYREA